MTTAPVAADSATAARTAKGTATVKAPPRRRAHLGLVALVAAVVLGLATATLGVLAYVMNDQQRAVEDTQARKERFVDTGKQTVVNMFSYTQDTIDESVTRFIDGTSGPLRDMMSQGNNADNLKALFRDTQASSEAVVNGAALEDVDEIARNASVLVAVRVTVTDLDGVNAPTRPYRLRVIVHEDDNGHMTGYDLKYPDGGN
ncbi:mammalian cell entry protein [Mycobacterium sp. TNTM28]|uniref:Mammalian cell entry protein n=1 Tax=[Mycobacterium] fortunisiensis TaxID=2600579 RepID=A0ABS6KHU3_9MYCO|nr:mammalian cell entry protein [[Mycobacterium] fortunisiensis]